MSNDTVQWGIEWGVRKYDEDSTAWLTRRLGFEPVEDDFIAARVKPFENNVIPGNLLTTAGLQRLTNLLIASGGTQALTQTSGRIGTGNGAGTAAVGDTDLSPASHVSTNQWFNILDSASLTAVGGLVSLKATFLSADGNYAWTEFGIDIGTPTVANGATVNALLLNHKTGIAQGTKIAGQSWTASASITFS